ncbi:IclR family transcriptional regulator C-terminal domain-containing protein [Rhodococcus sp. USK13]|uniref:IclR family transcriptional regulator n=1 Tax=Rhodococcus sp. USK13 TaxID=2806442 RepID=UPI001BCBE431|nr:IclR family transcriptional regulator C-terminal domain-containing protein [Rhodococcus sp. USK13]
MSPHTDPSRHHPSTVSNSLDILEVVATLGLGVTAKEIAGALHLPQATAYRLINSLVAEEYLVRTSDLRGFGLGARLNGLVTAAASPTVPTAARRQLDDLRDNVRFAVHVIAFHNTTLRVLDADPDHPVRAERELVRYPHASAAGKLLLADRTIWQEALPSTPLRQLTSATVIDLAALDTELRTIRDQQFAVQVDQLEQDLACLAVPLRDPDGNTAGALCLAGPSARIDALLGRADSLQQCAGVLAPLLF